jgi:hypothetical protein
MRQSIDAIKSAIRVDDYAARYLKVINGKTHCIAHEERTASLVLHDQWAKCFGCGWHGDVIDFAAKYHHISTGDAIRMLADEAGVELKPGSPVKPYDRAKADRIAAEAEEWRTQVRRRARNLSATEILLRLSKRELVEEYTMHRTQELGKEMRALIRDADLWVKAVTPLIGTLIDRLASAPESEFVPEPEVPEAPYGPRCW